jgi:putative MATE family efflux protein
MALPASIGLFFQTMYNVVDSFYAGQISTTALAALGLSFPVFLLIIASSSGTSRGTSALIANAIGSGDEDKQQQYIAQSLSLGFLLSIVMTALGLMLASPLFQLMGADGDYLETSLKYIRPIFMGAVFLIMSSLSNGILVAHGDSKTYSRVLIVGFFMNLALDPWFVYGGWGLPAMGITGIALATVLIQFFGCVYMFSAVVGRGLVSISDWRRFIPDLRIFAEIAQQALPASFNTMSVALGFFVTTYFLKTFGESTVAAYAVTTRIEQIVLLPSFGLYAAIMALVGQNNGAGKIDRVNETMRVCNRFGLILTLSSSVVMFALASFLMRVFSDDPEVIGIGVTCLRIFAFVQWAYVMTSTHIAMLQAIKRPMYGFFESVTRKIILPMPLLWLFIARWNQSVLWIWYTSATTTILMTVVTVGYARWVLKKKTDARQTIISAESKSDS